MKTAIIKVFRDIKGYRARSFIILLGIFMGISAIGAVLTAYSILSHEMNRNYMDTNPASIIIYSGNLDQKAVDLVKARFINIDVEVRKTITARIDAGDGTYGIISLRAIEDFGNLKVDTFTPEKGCLPANNRELVLERDSFKVLKNVKGVPGEILNIKLPGGKEGDFVLAGVVHAPGLAPASMEHFSYAFLTLEGLRELGYRGWYDEIRIVSYNDRFDREKMKELSRRISDTLLKSGYSINKIDVPVPGKHPHANQLDSILFLLQAFAFVSLLAACLIIINLLNFILSGQSRQIAIMKSVGASAVQIAIPYFLYVLIMASTGLLLSIPASLAAGAAYSEFAAGILNFKIYSCLVPAWVFVLQASAGILVPLISAAFPIIKSCKKHVREGLYENTAVSSKEKSSSKRPIGAITSLFRIPAANLGRKRSRTILAVIAVAMGGTLFMASQNITASVKRTVDESFNARKWDFDIMLSGIYDKKQIGDAFSKIQGISGYEVWEGGLVKLSGKGSGNSSIYQIRMLPDDTGMSGISTYNQIGSGGKAKTILVNKLLSDEETWIKIGSTVCISAGGNSEEFIIAGLVNEVPALSPTIYIDQASYEKYFGHGSKQSIFVSSDSRDKSVQLVTLKNIEKQFAESGIVISENWTVYLLRKAFIDHLYIIITLLEIISGLAVLVGGMSITSSIGISISERKREIGIMRASGANRNQTIFMTLIEALMVGSGGWLLSAALSIPVSTIIGNYFGNIFLESNLSNVISISGIAVWFVLSLAISSISAVLPATRAAKSSLRDMLAYE